MVINFDAGQVDGGVVDDDSLNCQIASADQAGYGKSQLKVLELQFAWQSYD